MDLENQVLPIDSEENQRLRKWRSEFQQDFDYFTKWHKIKTEWERFYDGDQLSSQEKQALADRRQPEVVINLIKPRIDGVIGDFLGRRVMMKARDKGSADFEKAKYITEALRYIEDMNRFDDQESRVAEDLFIGGVGWYKVNLKFDFLEPEISIAHRDNNDIILDRRARRNDLKDAKRLYETVWVEVEDLIELYPDEEDFIKKAANTQRDTYTSGSNPLNSTSYAGDDYEQSNNVSPDTGIDFETFVDPERKRIRLVNVWERVQKRVEFAFHPDIDGTVVEITDYDKEELAALEANFKGLQKHTEIRWELNSGIFIHNKILDDKLNVRPHDSEGKFPFARAVGHKEHGELKLPYGMVRQYIDAQKEYNKRRSKLLHKSNTNRIIAERGAIPDEDMEKVRKEAARPDGVIITNPGKQFQIDSDQPSQTDVFLLQLAQSEIESSGVSGEFLGQENKGLSGKAINLRQAAGQKMLRPFYAALRSARRDIFSIVLEEMQQFWTAEKLIKITDDPQAGGMMLNQRTVDPNTGQVVIVNNLRLGKYDIKIDEDVETPNQRQENFLHLTQLAGPIIQSGQPFPIEMLINSSDMPGKQELVQMISQEKQRQLQIAQAQAIAATAAQQAGAAQTGSNPTPG